MEQVHGGLRHVRLCLRVQACVDWIEGWFIWLIDLDANRSYRILRYQTRTLVEAHGLLIAARLAEQVGRLLPAADEAYSGGSDGDGMRLTRSMDRMRWTTKQQIKHISQMYTRTRGVVGALAHARVVRGAPVHAGAVRRDAGVAPRLLVGRHRRVRVHCVGGWVGVKDVIKSTQCRSLGSIHPAV